VGIPIHRLGITNLIDEESTEQKKDETVTTTFRAINFILDDIGGSLLGGNHTVPKINSIK